MEKRKINNKFHLVLIGFLLILFFSLLLYSTVDNSTINYELKSYDQNLVVEERLLIGKVDIKNNNVLPSKVFLKKYVVCDFSNSYPNSYIVNYVGEKIGQEYYNMFNEYQKPFIELSSKEEIKLNLVVNRFPIQKPASSDEELIQRNLYLYELNYEEEIWNSCESKSPSDALRTYTLTE